MITRYPTVYGPGYDVAPQVRVAAGKATVLEFNYVWEGRPGTVPPLSIDLTADAGGEKNYLAAVYQNASGERKVVLDSGVVKIGIEAAETSADSVLAAQGWTRCFLIFQIFIPAGLMGSVEEENSIVHVFEARSSHG